MNQRFLQLAFCMFLSALVFAMGNEDHVMGTVTKVDEESISVKTKTGKIRQ